MFRRREGHLLAALLGPSLRHRLVLRLYPFTRRSSFRGSLPVVHPQGWPTLPSSLRTCSLRHSPFRGGYLFWGRRMCFPSAVDLAFCNRFLYVIFFLDVFRGVSVYRGGRTLFPTAFKYMDFFTFAYFFHCIVYADANCV